MGNNDILNYINLNFYFYINNVISHTMIINVYNRDSMQLLRTIDYTKLLEICYGDAEIADDFIRLIKHHPNNDKDNEIWLLVEE